MTWWQAGLWGLAGGACIELVDLYKLVHLSDGTYSMPSGGRSFWIAYALAVAIRLVLGFATAWAMLEGNQIVSGLGAFGVGAGATGIVEHLGRAPRQPEVPQQAGSQ